MLRAASVLRAGEFGEADVIDRVVLDADQRHRRRVVLIGERGTRFLVDLPHAMVLKNGDGLTLDDGSIVQVTGRAEQLCEIEVRTPLDLVRLAWHLGNRHADLQVLDGRLRIRRDHVLEEMIVGLGGSVAAIDAPFEPEPGMYLEAGGHGGTAGSAEDAGGGP